MIHQVSCCAVFCAALGFSLALATSESRDTDNAVAGPVAQSRFVGQPMRFTNSFFVAGTNPAFSLASDSEFPQGGDVKTDPDGFDLGDASFGNPLVRYFSAAGGYLPYTFMLKPLLSGSMIPVSLPMVSRSGKLTGIIAPMVGSVLRFAVELTDFVATQRTGIFKLNLFPQITNFRFAHSQLPTAQLGNSYYTNIEALGGQPPVRFDVLPGSISAQGGVSCLEDVGLSLSSDGTLIGRPLVAVPIKFTVRASDATANTALARMGDTFDQQFTIPVEANTIITTELAATVCKIYGHTISAGADGFTYSGVLDGKGDIAPSLAGSTFTLRVGSASFTGSFDAKGKSFNVKGESLGAQSKFAVSFSPRSGRFRVKIRDANLNAALGATNFKSGIKQNVVIALEIGALRTCEVLTIAPVVRGEHYRLNYKLGGKESVSACGAFQILSVCGVDAKANGLTGDRWLVRFLGVPRGIDGTLDVASASNVTVRIGAVFSQSVNVALKQVRLEFKATSKDRGIFQLFLNPESFIHRFQTNFLTKANDTGIPAASETNDAALELKERAQPALFPLGVDFKGFSGENGRVIIPARKTWSQR
ncbi:MAG: hypothetical protein V1899_07785 [Planctomycetota bacterium]